MKSNPLVELQKLGQSIWYDNIRRALLLAGDLQQKIAEDDLRGVTSNPAIFEKAIAGSNDYNEALKSLAAMGKSTNEIYEDLVVEDIRTAADIFLPVYQKTGGIDGYVSLEVSPLLARDTAGTVAEALRLWKWLDRKNVMIKVPATEEGLPAVEQLIRDGINVNVTLIFSQEMYVRVADAYITGLKKRAAAGKPVDHVASVASFFVSRIDSLIDSQLNHKIRNSTDPGEVALFTSLLGKVAIANAKLAYATFKEIFGKEPFLSLKAKGAKVQRQLWASTGTKDPNYSDVLYVDTLIGPDTVNTVPPATFTAYRDHGNPALTLESDIEGARETVKNLEKAGISLSKVTSQLLEDGVKAFVEPFDKMIAAIEEKRAAVAASIVDRQILRLCNFHPTLETSLKLIEDRQYMRRLWRKDPTIWKEDPAHTRIISNSLGWLSIAETMLGQVDDLKAFADRIKTEGFESVVLLGMGGSSLCPEVLRRTFVRIPGFPRFIVLDSTDPETIRSVDAQIDPLKTLFIVSSKSGTTIETAMFYKYYFDRVARLRSDRPGANFIAITDAGSALESIGHEKLFRRIFVNPATMGGRYSALSYFGMVPAALMGLDVKELLERAVDAVEACERYVPTVENPGARLGALFGGLASRGIDKVTLITPPPFDSLGLWIEQLVSESTGKEGMGIIAVSGEPLGNDSVYEHDRIFVYITPQGVSHPAIEEQLKELEEDGHPVVHHVLRDAVSLGREFFIWEIATAIAGAFLGVNPFDQPNVNESKENTLALLSFLAKHGHLPEQEILWEGDGCRIYCDAETRAELARTSTGGTSFKEWLAAHLHRANKGDYVALTAYIPENDENEKLLQAIRTHIRDVVRTATTVAYGPRSLHSSSQLHKGGGGNGLFIQITADHPADIPIPGEAYTFGVLTQADALGDFESLSSRKRRAIRFHAGANVKHGLELLLSGIRDALPKK